MRIGILFPSIYASLKLFPDKIFAPRELCITLVNGLVSQGHEVFVYSVPDLPVRAEIHSDSIEHIVDPLVYHKFRGMDEVERKRSEKEFSKHAFEMQCVSKCFADASAGKLDLIHVYLDSSMFISHYMQSIGCPVPVVYTLHDPLPPNQTFEYEEFSRFQAHAYVAISNNFRQSPLQLNFIDTVYHGIDTSVYSYDGSLDSSYVFMGRLIPEKGLEDAIKACVITNASLQVASYFPKPRESEYVDTVLSPLLEYPHLNKIGMVSDGEKVAVLGRSKALLFPIKWEEPFGMVLIESMACGTPVIAYNHGSVPEIVVDGVTGFIIDSDDGYTNGHTGTWIIKKRGVEGLVEAMGRIGEIDRKKCREHVLAKFSIEQMVKGYERVYEKIVK